MAKGRSIAHEKYNEIKFFVYMLESKSSLPFEFTLLNLI